MSKRLNHIKNWSELAQEVKWQTVALAKRCGVSVRTLERHFRQMFAETPKAWLAEKRHENAIRLINNGATIKEAAACLGYNYPTNLTRKLKTAHAQKRR
jgi:AraC-like DNA-binding protein